MSVISFEEARKRLAKDGNSKFLSLLSTPPEKAGQKLISREDEKTAFATAQVMLVIIKALEKGFSCKGEFARRMAVFVAAAAELGAITTRIDDTQFGSVWSCTEDGLDWLKEMLDDEIEIID